MLRFFGSSGRTLISANPALRSVYLQSFRAASNQPKVDQTEPTDEKLSSKPNRFSSPPVKRRVNIKKIFSDENSNEDSLPTSPRRANVPSSASFNDPARLTANLSTKSRYENEIADIADYHSEEQRRRTVRQNQARLTHENAQPKSNQMAPRKKSANAIEIEKLFDETEYISPKKTTRQVAKPTEKFNQNQQPRQPRKERTLTKQPNEPSASNQSNRDPLLFTSIEQANTTEELLKIFDKYVVPTEFALGLQKLNQLASAESSDSVQTYGQLDEARTRMETLLLGFVNKFSDNEIATAIAFVAKYYPENNEFTDKFSVMLTSRLRRISVHQIVRILDELKASRHTAQWIHRVYNRLLALAEGRYFEFDNIRDILALTHKLSYNDRLINRLDERILEITDTLTFDDWFKILINKSMLKRRDRTIIRAACYHLLKLSDSFLFPIEKIKDCLLACAMLNVYDKPFLERLTRDAYEQVHLINDTFMLQSIITSMGTLRIRHCELLDAFGKSLLEDPESKARCIPSFIRTCASVNYAPSTLSTLVDKHLKLDETSTDETNQMNEIKNQIDLVWSLAILDQANQTHVAQVLNQDIFQLIQNEVMNSKIASALKLLSIYSYSLQKFSKKFLKPTFNIEQLAQQLTLKNSNAQDQLAKAVTIVAPENKYSKFSVVTSNMIVIDCLMVVDKSGTPQDLSTVLTNGENNSTTGQTTYNKVRIDDSRFKVALKCLDYQDKTLITNSVSGPIALQLRLLNSLGYKCVPIHYDEFMKIQVPTDRVKYVQRKIKEAVGASSATDRQVNTPSRERNADD
ncbi:unnamed protein product [Adineta ricciae]|uniref:RAP domain-containing protein n=1 Tax=Adineta ricciae TaxID=249248 RepID=A0A814R9V9_ADIRI|nr:unnamed protein product [Adineta ricciae]CAF1130596.1 unnamed protein product [Adineta ricciae]